MKCLGSTRVPACGIRRLAELVPWSAARAPQTACEAHALPGGRQQLAAGRAFADGNFGASQSADRSRCSGGENRDRTKRQSIRTIFVADGSRTRSLDGEIFAG